MRRGPKVAGTCYLCRRPVLAREAVRVIDAMVKGRSGLPVRRLAHPGDCAAELRSRIGGGSP